MAKDARYFTHDSNARHDPKIQALLKKYKVEGYGRFWIIIETMRETRGYKLTLKKYVLESLSEQMQCTVKDVENFIKDCVKEFELLVQDGEFFYSESLIERMAKLDYIRSIRQKAAYVMHEKHKHNITKDPETPDDF